MFWLKKVIGIAIMPLPLCLCLFSIGLLLLALKQRLRGWICLLCCWTILITAANRGVATAITATLERTYPAAPSFLEESSPAGTLRGVRFIAILGSGHGDALGLSAGQRLSPSAKARLMEGVRLAHGLPESKLVTFGPRPSDKPNAPTHARVLADAAEELGIARARIIEIDHPRDTAEEIQALASLANQQPTALVTSAWHMPRAMTLVRNAGTLNTLPCPADYLGGRDASIPTSAWLSWSAEALTDTTRAWREYIGRLWIKVTNPLAD